MPPSIRISTIRRPFGWRGVLTVMNSGKKVYSRWCPIIRQTQSEALQDAEAARTEALVTGQLP